MMENEQSTAINPSEAVEEKVSLSDRFGLWLGFYKCSQEDYLAMVDGYARYYNLPVEPEALHSKRWNGQRRGEQDPAASPGSSFRISPAAFAGNSTHNQAARGLSRRRREDAGYRAYSR